MPWHPTRMLLLLAFNFTTIGGLCATIENDRLKVEIDDAGGAKVFDKRTNLLWSQPSPVMLEDEASTGTQARGKVRQSELPRITSVQAEGNEIIVKADWLIPLVMRWSLQADDELLLTIDSPDLQTPLKNDDKKWGPMLMYPPPFYNQEAARFAVVPEDEGCIYSTSGYNIEDDIVAFTYKRYSGGDGIANYSLPFNGLTDLKRGVMNYLETGFHAAGRMTLYDTSSGRCALPGIGWTNARGSWGFARRLRFKFIEDGGYVAMAKRFRQDLIQGGRFKSLKEKAAERPPVEKLKGAMNLWVFAEEPLTQADIKRVRSFGFENLLFQVFAKGTHPTPEDGLTPEAVEETRRNGWLTGSYHLYSWMYLSKDRPLTEEQMTQSINESATQPYLAPGGVWGGHTLRCPAVLGDKLAALAREEKAYGMSSFFTDCTFCGDAVRDCYSPDHPLTREQAGEALNAALEQVAREGMVVGSERGFWWGATGADYFEGVETLIMYFNRWNGPDIPHMHSGDMQEQKPGYQEFFVGYNYGPHNRVPLFQLVMHDAVVAMRRWDDHHSRDQKMWRRNDLMAIAYGVPPIVCFHLKAGPHILRDDYLPLNERYMRTYRDVCGWHEEVGFEEMTDHKFLTEDRMVQETSFGNGRKVVVNFKKEAWKDPRGFEVEAEGFRRVE